jgi:PTH1 family peptidyl-tRNA hydrolase
MLKERQNMYIIAGLGNPESKYDKTRHNIGFRLIDELAVRNGITFSDRKHNGLVGKGIISGEKVILLKPLTYMNLSGECVGPAADYYKVEPENVIILFDDISLDVGRIRIRKKGSAGGHNGIKSIIAHLGSENFLRLKFGVGDKPKEMDLADYVLGRFSSQDEATVSEGIKRACEAVECMIGEGCDVAMNKYNG